MSLYYEVQDKMGCDVREEGIRGECRGAEVGQEGIRGGESRGGAGMDAEPINACSAMSS
jgi:hypothetical protein